MKQKPELIHCTHGLCVTGHTYKKALLVKIEAYRNADGSVTLKSISGHTLGDIPQAGHVRLSAEEWEDRPSDPYDDLQQTKWALTKCGWSWSADRRTDQDWR